MHHFFFNNYKSLLLSGIVLISFAFLLMISETNYTIIQESLVSKPVSIFIHVSLFVICWLILASLLSKFSVYKVLGIVSLLFLSIISERYLAVQNNPVTIPLIILFWLGVIHLVLPDFFKRYKYVILGVYGLMIAYFLILYITTLDFSNEDREHFASFMIAPIPFFVVLWTYENWRSYRMLQAEKAATELSLLKSQINPHFFFNTLNNLYGLVVEKSDQAPEVVLKLSDMMRYTIYEGKKDVISLREELAYLTNYIELHKIRYQKKVTITFTHTVNEQLQVTPLLFIILLENAFKHGVEKLRSNAFIHMHMESTQEELIFTIENNFDPTASETQQGIGLANLKKRLLYSYANRHELIIDKEANVYRVKLILELT